STLLPGTFMFGEGDPASQLTSDLNAKGAYFRIGQVYDFYKNVLGRDSIKDLGEPIVSTVHVTQLSGGQSYGRGWGWLHSCTGNQGEGQLIFGNGDGINYGKTVNSLDVVAHEYTHGIIDATASLFIGNIYNLGG